MLIHYFPFEEDINDIKGSGLVLSPPPTISEIDSKKCAGDHFAINLMDELKEQYTISVEINRTQYVGQSFCTDFEVLSSFSELAPWGTANYNIVTLYHDRWHMHQMTITYGGNSVYVDKDLIGTGWHQYVIRQNSSTIKVFIDDEMIWEGTPIAKLGCIAFGNAHTSYGGVYCRNLKIYNSFTATLDNDKCLYEKENQIYAQIRR